MVTALAVGALIVIGWCMWSLQTSVGTMSINGTEISVRIAERALGQKKGLSGYTEESFKEDGMLFLFSESNVRTFWMKDMNFNLDILWIENGKVVAMDRNVPAPFSRTDAPAQVSSNPLAVNAVLELPAGRAEELGLVEGMSVVLSE